jgi:hypothetical protein
MLLLDHNGVKPETNSKKNYRNWRIHGEWKKKKNKTSGHWQKSKKLRKFFKLNENESRNYQNHLNIARTVLKEEFMGMCA